MASADDRDLADKLLAALEQNTAMLERHTAALAKLVPALEDVGHELFRLVENKRDPKGPGQVVNGVLGVARDVAEFVSDFRQGRKGKRLPPLR